MRVLTVSLSIAPGHPKPVTQAALDTLRASPAAPHACWMLSAEIGEVNRLIAAFAGAPADTLLDAAGHWLAALQSTPAAQALRGVDVALRETTASADAVAQIGSNPKSCVLLQVLAEPPADGVCLSPLTGPQGHHWVLSTCASHDEALARSRRTVEADAVAVIDSGLWLPLSLSLPESKTP